MVAELREFDGVWSVAGGGLGVVAVGGGVVGVAWGVPDEVGEVFGVVGGVLEPPAVELRATTSWKGWGWPGRVRW